jgi:hypothetical protein
LGRIERLRPFFVAVKAALLTFVVAFSAHLWYSGSK